MCSSIMAKLFLFFHFLIMLIFRFVMSFTRNRMLTNRSFRTMLSTFRSTSRATLLRHLHWRTPTFGRRVFVSPFCSLAQLARRFVRIIRVQIDRRLGWIMDIFIWLFGLLWNRNGRLLTTVARKSFAFLLKTTSFHRTAFATRIHRPTAHFWLLALRLRLLCLIHDICMVLHSGNVSMAQVGI